MNLNYDEYKIQEGVEDGVYDERNLSISRSGKYKYPSKYMFIKFLEQFEDIDGEADIWSIEHHEDGTCEIHVDVKYKVKKL